MITNREVIMRERERDVVGKGNGHKRKTQRTERVGKRLEM